MIISIRFQLPIYFYTVFTTYNCFLGLGLALSAYILYVYQSHVEHMDILGVKRKRFMALSNNQMKKLATFEFKQVIHL